MRASAWLLLGALAALAGCTVRAEDGVATDEGGPTSELSAAATLGFGTGGSVGVVYGRHRVFPYRVLRLRFARFADNDGSHAAVLTDTDVERAIDAVNAVFYQSGSDIRVARDPATDLSTLHYSTNFNNECLPVSGWQFLPHDADGDGTINDDVDGAFVCPPLSPDRSQGVRDAVIGAIQATGAIPVLVRGGFSSVGWDAEFPFGWFRVVGPGIGTFYSHLSMPEKFTGDTLMPHELGHTLGLFHTFRDCYKDDCKKNPEWSGSPYTVAGLANQIILDVLTSQHVPSDSAGILGAVFDGDKASGVTDTNPDPNYKVWATVFGDDLSKGEITKLCKPANDKLDISVQFPWPIGGSYWYHFEPDRRNVLSYFKTCWNSNYHYFHYSQSQLDLVDAGLNNSMPWLDQSVVFTDAWENTTNLNLPPREFGSQLVWATSKITVRGAPSTATKVLVHVDMKTETGSYYLKLFAPYGTIYTLQSPGSNDPIERPLVENTIYPVSIIASPPINGTWELRVADYGYSYPDAYRYVDRWSLEFR
ncbi:MAG: proprotein convertase P-domain-containing protein [Polyangiaceae bacterium]